MNEFILPEDGFRQVAEALPQLMWTCQPDGRCDFINRMWIQYTGIPLDRQLGYGWLQQLHADDRDMVFAKWNESISRLSPFHIQYRIRGADGIYRWFKTSAVPIKNSDGVVIKWFGLNSDIDELKRAEETMRRQQQELEEKNRHLQADLVEQRRMEGELRKTKDELELRVRERTAELEEANEALSSFPSRILSIQEEERDRIASELHDSVGQTLAALKYGLETILSVREQDDAERTFKLLEKIVPRLKRSIEETNAIYEGLRPTMIDTLGIVAALKWYCREFQKLHSKHRIEFEANIEEQMIPEHLKIVIFRIAQEALTNVAKHSNAQWVKLTLEESRETIALEIRDCGVGVDPNTLVSHMRARSLGITGMRERAELTGGSFTIESAPGEGTIIQVAWPPGTSKRVAPA